jgi:hypothetical protein
MTTQVIVAAACELRTGEIVVGVRHWDMIMHGQAVGMAANYARGSTQGFIDNRGSFLGREEALEVAKKAGQINRFRKKTQPEDKLFSEDLY